MRRRHPPPRVWLMTDERMGEALWPALDRLPRGAGVVFRHYGLAYPERRALLSRVERVARRRRLVVLGAGELTTPDGGHNRKRRRGLYTRSAHGLREIIAAQRAGADLVFVSPVYPTRSHPDARALGRARFGLMIRNVNVPVIALGGMDVRRARMLQRLGAYGWAAIDAWLPAADRSAKYGR